MLEVGSILDGKYKILSEIGHGGMSVVYLAINESANKTWAVKVVRKYTGNDSGVISMGLAAEAKMLRKLRHPNLPGIVDVIDREDSFIIVMDYIEGNSLQHLIDTTGPQEAEEVIGWAKQLCDVLSYLHSRTPPIIYRDMKPANIMLRPDGKVMLIDFGTAREYKETRSEDTTCLGTRGYAAPEQFGGRGQTDGRTDIYNLGATMYHLVTGCSPADTDYIIYPVGRFIPRLKGSGLEKVIAGCCRPAPEDRFQSTAQLMYVLDHVHDEDNEAIRTRNRRWRAFISFCAMAAAALFMGIVFGVLYKNSLSSVYARYLTDAETGQTLMDQISGCRMAVEIAPGRPEAWDLLIRSIQDRDHESLSSGEVDEIRNCIKTGSDGSNLQHLKKHDRRAYARFNYNLGIILFFSSDNGRSGSFDYLSEAAANKKRLSASEAGIAELMYELARVDQEKNRNTSDWAGGKGYKDYWETLNDLLNGRKTTLDRIAEECGSEGYPLAICNEVASAVYRHLSRFRGQGVTIREIETALQISGTYVEKTFYIEDRSGRLLIREDLDENMKVRAEQTERMIEDAKETVRELCDRTDTNEERTK